MKLQNISLKCILLYFIVMLCIRSESSAQQQNLPLNKKFFIPEEVIINQTNQIIHSSFQPLLQSRVHIDLNKKYAADTSYFLSSLKKLPRKDRSLFSRKFFFEHLFVVDTTDFYLTLDPLFNLEVGKDLKDSSEQLLYKNTRGFLLRGNIGQKLSFESGFRENQARFPNYVKQRVEQTSVAVGQGRVKDFGEDAYDFAMASAYVSYSPSQSMNFQIGHGKHFIGNGYRSHFLSDRSFNYPFLKISTELFKAKLQYTNLYTSFQDLKRLDYKNREGLFQRKMGNFIYLDYAVNENFYLGLFEGSIWPTTDSSGRLEQSWMAYNPVILVNSVINSFDEYHASSLLGLNLRWDLIRAAQIYAQLASDLSSEESTSFQLGIKIYPLKHFFFQAEYNSNKKNQPIERSDADFTHYSANLNFNQNVELNEIFFRGNFSYQRIVLDFKLNIFESREMNQIFMDICSGYIINPATNFSINAGSTIRMTNLDGAVGTQFFYLSLRTNLQNLYYDF